VYISSYGGGDGGDGGGGGRRVDINHEKSNHSVNLSI